MLRNALAWGGRSFVCGAPSLILTVTCDVLISQYPPDVEADASPERSERLVAVVVLKGVVWRVVLPLVPDSTRVVW